MKSDVSLLRHIGRETAGLRWHIAGVVALGLFATPLALLTPIPLKIAVDTVLGSEPPPDPIRRLTPWLSSDAALLVGAAVLVVLIGLLTHLQLTGRTLLETYTGEQLTLRFRSKLLAHAQRLSFAYHDTRGSADAMYRIQRDATCIQSIAIGGLISFLSAAVTLTSMIAIVVRIDAHLAAIALAIAPVLFASGYFYKVRMRGRYAFAKELESGALQVMQEILTSGRVVKAFGREAAEEARFRGQSMKGVQARLRLTMAEGLYGLAVSAVTAVGTATVLFVGVRHVQAGTLTLGNLLIVMSYLTQLYHPLKTVSKNVASMQNQLASADRAFALLDVVPDVIEKRHPRRLGRAKGDIEFRDVTFGYEPGQVILDRISLAVPAGCRLGVVGLTGAGKTTLVNLLPRFYDPTAGSILLDGVDVREYALADLRHQFSIVLQEPVLFATTIGQNIAYARPDARENDIVAAARAAGAHDFIVQLPQGYATVVGERGMRLSGGERQRISLARAFLKDAPLLILDEPTSAVDVHTEAAILATMERLMAGRTTVMIAHRSSTVRGCDAMLEIRGGSTVLHSSWHAPRTDVEHA